MTWFPRMQTGIMGNGVSSSRIALARFFIANAGGYRAEANPRIDSHTFFSYFRACSGGLPGALMGLKIPPGTSI